MWKSYDFIRSKLTNKNHFEKRKVWQKEAINSFAIPQVVQIILFSTSWVELISFLVLAFFTSKGVSDTIPQLIQTGKQKYMNNLGLNETDLKTIICSTRPKRIKDIFRRSIAWENSWIYLVFGVDALLNRTFSTVSRKRILLMVSLLCKYGENISGAMGGNPYSESNGRRSRV